MLVEHMQTQPAVSALGGQLSAGQLLCLVYEQHHLLSTLLTSPTFNITHLASTYSQTAIHFLWHSSTDIHITATYNNSDELLHN